VGQRIRVTSSSTLERKHKCDPSVENFSRVLLLDPATLAGPSGPIEGSGDPLTVGPQAHFLPFFISYMKTSPGTSGTCY
jgi:hypothetical protein